MVLQRLQRLFGGDPEAEARESLERARREALLLVCHGPMLTDTRRAPNLRAVFRGNLHSREIRWDKRVAV